MIDLNCEIVIPRTAFFYIRQVHQLPGDASKNFHQLLSLYSVKSITFNQTAVQRGVYTFEAWLYGVWVGFKAEYQRLWNVFDFNALSINQQLYLGFLNGKISPHPDQLPKFDPRPEPFLLQIRAAHLDHLCDVAYQCETNLSQILTNVTTHLFNITIEKALRKVKVSKTEAKLRKFVKHELNLVQKRQALISKFRATKLTWKKFNDIELELLQHRHKIFKVVIKLKFLVVHYNLAGEFSGLLTGRLSKFRINGGIIYYEV